MNKEPDHENLLRDFHPDALHSAQQIIYAIRPDLSLAYANLDLTHFASWPDCNSQYTRNWPIGCCVLEVIPAALRPFVAENFAKCLREKRPWEHHYELTSRGSNRHFVMMAYPIGESEGVLVVNSLVHESCQATSSIGRLEALYENDYGIITQCCHCRRVRRCGIDATWDLVADWVNGFPSNTSHGLCEPCSGYYYSSRRPPRKGFPETFQTGEPSVGIPSPSTETPMNEYWGH